jgi:hypothetical protein
MEHVSGNSRCIFPFLRRSSKDHQILAPLIRSALNSKKVTFIPFADPRSQITDLRSRDIRFFFVPRKEYLFPALYSLFISSPIHSSTRNSFADIIIPSLS